MKDLFGHDKIEEAIERIKIFEPPEGYYGATSFGKDSIALMHLVKRADVKVDWHYNITGIDPPELVYFGRKYYPEVERHRPEKTMWQLMVSNGLPTRQHRFCCKYLKEPGGTGRKVLTGIRWEESFKRSKRRMVEQCYRDESKTFVHPLIDWSEREIWDYIKMNKLFYPSLYNEGWKRIGCVVCPMLTPWQRKRSLKRWPKFWDQMKRCAYKYFERRQDVLKKKYNFVEFQDYWDWWWSNKSVDNPDQTVMFE